MQPSPRENWRHALSQGLAPKSYHRAPDQGTGAPLEFSHTLEDQIGGQLDAGLLLTDFFEDGYDKEENDLLTNYMPTFIATRATKPYHKIREDDLA